MPPPAAGANTPATRATPLSSGSPTAVSAPDQSAAVAGAGQVYGAQNRNSRVVLRARADTTLTVKNPAGQIMLNRTLKAGDSYQVPDMPGLTMAAGDASAVEIDLDGVSLGKAGQTQSPVGRVSLDAQSLADRFNNH
jgi:cytoskeleton protein RodZ